MLKLRNLKHDIDPDPKAFATRFDFFNVDKTLGLKVEAQIIQSRPLHSDFYHAGSVEEIQWDFWGVLRRLQATHLKFSNGKDSLLPPGDVGSLAMGNQQNYVVFLYHRVPLPCQYGRVACNSYAIMER